MEAATVGAPPVVKPTWPDLAIVNDKSSGVHDTAAALIADAIAAQILEDFGPIWHVGAHVHFVPSTRKPPAAMWCVALLSTSDEAGALGYHDLTPDGLPLGKVFAATDRQYGSNLGVTTSHEALEMLGDPWINLSAQSDDGKFYAWENCDAVEADQLGYTKHGATVSAFVTPAWFGHGAGELTFPKGLVSKPLELASGGYISVFDPGSGQGWSQVQADRAPLAEHFPGVARQQIADAIHAVPRVGSRRERRFRGRGLWVPSTFEQG